MSDHDELNSIVTFRWRCLLHQHYWMQWSSTMSDNPSSYQLCTNVNFEFVLTGWKYLLGAPPRWDSYLSWWYCGMMRYRRIYSLFQMIREWRWKDFSHDDYHYCYFYQRQVRWLQPFPSIMRRDMMPSLESETFYLRLRVWTLICDLWWMWELDTFLCSVHF